MTIPAPCPALPTSPCLGCCLAAGNRLGVTHGTRTLRDGGGVLHSSSSPRAGGEAFEGLSPFSVPKLGWLLPAAPPVPCCGFGHAACPHPAPQHPTCSATPRHLAVPKPARPGPKEPRPSVRSCYSRERAEAKNGWVEIRTGSRPACAARLSPASLHRKGATWGLPGRGALSTPGSSPRPTA